MGIFTYTKEILEYIPEEDRIDTFMDEEVTESVIALNYLILESRYVMMESDQKFIIKKIYDTFVKFIKYVKEKIKDFFSSLVSKLKDARDRLKRIIPNAKVDTIIKFNNDRLGKISFPEFPKYNFLNLIGTATDIIIHDGIDWKIYDNVKKLRFSMTNDKSSAYKSISDFKNKLKDERTDDEFEELKDPKHIYQKLPLLNDPGIDYNDSEKLKSYLFNKIAPHYMNVDIEKLRGWKAESYNESRFISYPIRSLSDIDKILKPFYDIMDGADRLSTVYKQFNSRFDTETKKIEEMFRTELREISERVGAESVLNDIVSNYTRLTKNRLSVFMTYVSSIAWVFLSVNQTIYQIRSLFYTDALAEFKDTFKVKK